MYSYLRYTIKKPTAYDSSFDEDDFLGSLRLPVADFAPGGIDEPLLQKVRVYLRLY